MKTLLTIALALLCSIATQAAPNLLVEQGDRVRAIGKTLPGVPSDWHFMIVNEQTWQDIVRTKRSWSNLGNSAASNLTAHLTFVREGYALRATDSDLRQILAHEMGHHLCGCQDENKANFYRDKI